jgi:DNA-binding MarR family transcriptional regulator
MEQLDGILYFLQKTHNSLNANYNDYCIELRPIQRTKGYDYKLSRPLNIWKIDDKSKHHLAEFLEAHKDKPYCLYYSIFYFDYDYPTKRKGYITSAASRFTEEIAIDFDKIGEQQFLEYKMMLENIGLEGLWVFTGHGYHLHLLLDNKSYDSTILLKTVYLLKSKGFREVDTACIDTGRVMRLPFTYNYKMLKDDKYTEKDPLYTDIVSDTDKRYAFSDIIKRLEAMETKDEQAFETYLNINKREEFKATELDKATVTYPYIDEFELPGPINKMLSYTPDGVRNITFGFLIKYFKQYMKLSKSNIYEIMSIWSKYAAHPRYDTLNLDFDRLYLINGLNYTAELSREFGIIDFTTLISDNDFIFISNDLINDLGKLSGKELRAYLAIKLLEYENIDSVQEKIAELLDISVRALNPTLMTLCKTKHAYKTKTNRREKELYKYNTAKIVNVSKGYSKFTYEEISSYLNDLSNNELKVFIFLKVKAFRTNTSHASQETLGELLNLKQNTISNIMKGLKEKDYINIEKTHVSKNISYCNYTIIK